MKKVFLAALLILALCLSLAACGSNTPETPDAPVVTDAPAATYAPDSVGAKLAALGFEELDLLVGSQDHIEIDDSNDYHLYSTQPFEEVAKALYDACAKAADDGKVRDYWSEEPIDFSFNEAEDPDYGYLRNGEFEDVMLSLIWVDEETGFTEYLLQWE